MDGLKDLRAPLRLSNMMSDAGFVDVSSHLSIVMLSVDLVCLHNP